MWHKSAKVNCKKHEISDKNWIWKKCKTVKEFSVLRCCCKNKLQRKRVEKQQQKQFAVIAAEHKQKQRPKRAQQTGKTRQKGRCILCALYVCVCLCSVCVKECKTFTTTKRRTKCKRGKKCLRSAYIGNVWNWSCAVVLTANVVGSSAVAALNRRLCFLCFLQTMSSGAALRSQKLIWSVVLEKICFNAKNKRMVYHICCTFFAWKILADDKEIFCSQ